MNKAPSHLSWCDSRSADLERLCLALPKTGSEAAWQGRNRQKAIGADLNQHPPAVLSLPRRHARPHCASLQSP
jgi:hypothetical protein